MTTSALRSGLLPPRPGLTEARTRLYMAAIELFGQRGYYGVSMRDLAASIGVQAPALYAHVTSKQQLLFELVTIGHEEHRDRLREALLDAGSRPADQIAAMVRAHVLTHLTYPDLARVANNEMRALSEPQLESVTYLRDETGRLFVDILERGVRLGAFQVDNPQRVMRAIADMGFRTAEWWSPADGVSPSELAEDYSRYALRLLA